MPHFHVSSSLNRSSIEAFGLDWTRMSVARGIAGSVAPEVEGCFLATDEWEAEYFLEMNNTGGPVDLWGVDGVDPAALVSADTGYLFLPATIPRAQLRLLRTDVPPLHR
ncbi:hypothetical protein P5P86_07375 [Nocardioides sp. BP30]|uniref:hypothetical protein n=1 Tax=Nocardioides sp. BP30 TaxID=3036374 RepID=UPI002469350A|nr:hypothetical protein [Nocardioides sp. BP30]WGL53645.1 hypothetical protein P5P86_07375 [Nocardioides sp. BP30]